MNIAIPDFGKTLRDVMIVAGQEKLREEMKKQKWYQRYSNTVTVALSGIATFAWWVSSQGWDLPEYVDWVIGGIFAAAGVLGVKATSNGLTPNVVNKSMNPSTMDAVAAEAEKLIADQLRLALEATPPDQIVKEGAHTKPINLDEDIQQMPTDLYRGRG